MDLDVRIVERSSECKGNRMTEAIIAVKRVPEHRIRVLRTSDTYSRPSTVADEMHGAHQAGIVQRTTCPIATGLSGLSTRMPIMLRSQWPWRPSESRGGIPGGRRHDLVFVDHTIANPYPVAQCAASRFDQP